MPLTNQSDSDPSAVTSVRAIDAEPPTTRQGGRFRREQPRRVRLARKVAVATRQLAMVTTAAGDGRQALLHIAILRGDEALIDGILLSLVGS